MHASSCKLELARGLMSLDKYNWSLKKYVAYLDSISRDSGG